LQLPRTRRAPVRPPRPRYGSLPREGRRGAARRVLLQRRDWPGGRKHVPARLHERVRLVPGGGVVKLNLRMKRYLGDLRSRNVDAEPLLPGKWPDLSVAQVGDVV